VIGAPWFKRLSYRGDNGTVAGPACGTWLPQNGEPSARQFGARTDRRSTQLPMIVRSCDRCHSGSLPPPTSTGMFNNVHCDSLRGVAG
jgi:hypothetical protein